MPLLLVAVAIAVVSLLIGVVIEVANAIVGGKGASFLPMWSGLTVAGLVLVCWVREQFR